MKYKKDRERANKWAKKKGDEAVLQRLEKIFRMDGTVNEACNYAGICTSTYYEWLDDPAFCRRMEAAQQFPFLKARKWLMKNIEREDIRAIDIFLKKRDPRYKDKSEVDVAATVEGVDIEIS